MGATYSRCFGSQTQVYSDTTYKRTPCHCCRGLRYVSLYETGVQYDGREPLQEEHVQNHVQKIVRKDATLVSARSIERQSHEKAQSDFIYNAFKDYEQAGDDYEPEPSKCKALNEQRVQEIRQAGIDADQPNPQLDRLTKLCASIFCVAGATITLYCGEVLVVKSRVGIDERVPKHLSMKLAIGAWATYATRPRLIAVADATLDARYKACS